MTKLRGLLDTLALNYRHRHYDKDKVFEPFKEPVAIIEKFHADTVAVDASRHLTPEGKRAARQEAGKAALAAIAKWHGLKLAGLDADLGQHRAALLPSTEKPDAHKIDFMLGLLQKHTPEEIAVFYGSATDAERLVMEAASASIGRMPVKTRDGLQWQPLLNPETVSDSLMARATAVNPDGARKFAELQEIRSTHVTVANHAAAEVRAGLEGV